jgi:hypothetical protein
MFESKDSVKVIPSWSFIYIEMVRESTRNGWFNILHVIGTIAKSIKYRDGKGS